MDRQHDLLIWEREWGRGRGRGRTESSQVWSEWHLKSTGQLTNSKLIFSISYELGEESWSAERGVQIKKR